MKSKEDEYAYLSDFWTIRQYWWIIQILVCGSASNSRKYIPYIRRKDFLPFFLVIFIQPKRALFNCRHCPICPLCESKEDHLIHLLVIHLKNNEFVISYISCFNILISDFESDFEVPPFRLKQMSPRLWGENWSGRYFFSQRKLRFIFWEFYYCNFYWINFTKLKDRSFNTLTSKK